MTSVTDEFINRWVSGRYFGAFKPVQSVFVRSGTFDRAYGPWVGAPVSAKIPKESVGAPWSANWRPTSAYQQIPNVQETSIEQSFDSNGIATATITVPNVLARAATGNLGMIYHYMELGALSPLRGYNAPYTYYWQLYQNEWFTRLYRNAQITVRQGYGHDTDVPVFSGLIDDVDLSSNPNKIVITARDFGKVLAEERLYGNVNGPKLTDPVIFSSGADEETTGISEGHSAEATSTRDGYPARFVCDTDVESRWISHDHTTDAYTEWVQVRVPKGRYESIVIHPRYPNMEVYLGVYARDNLLGGNSCQLDDLNIANGWVSVTDAEGGGVVPGENGGWAYLKKWSKMADAGRSYSIGHKLELGDDSVFRVGFRNLYKVGADAYRASVSRFMAVRRKSEVTVVTRLVGENADASSTRDGHPSSNVLDESTDSSWISTDHSISNYTEWVEIHVPQGRYDSFQIYTDYDNMDMYVGVFARPRQRSVTGKDNSGRVTTLYYPAPCQVNDADVPNGWIDFGQGNVPGTNGGWPYALNTTLRKTSRADNRSPEKFSFGRKLELGKDSVIRVGFRNLYNVGGNTYRAQVTKLKAYTRTGVKQPDQEEKVEKIMVGDVSDIVRVILRWAGFKEWVIENTGAKLKGDWNFNRQTYMIDAINKVKEATGFVFFIAPPTDNDASIGIPVFRNPTVLRDDLPNIRMIRDDKLLTGVQVKISEEPLPYIIYVRGAVDAKGTAGTGSDKGKRWRATYRPPWVGSMGGVLKHEIKTEERLTSQKGVDVFARLIALQAALNSMVATIEFPATPEIDLDYQVLLWDVGTGMKTRLYITGRSITFSSDAEKTNWKMTTTGSMIDTPEMWGVKNDLNSLVPPGSFVSIDDSITND